jgi:hypothetical protein
LINCLSCGVKIEYLFVQIVSSMNEFLIIIIIILSIIYFNSYFEFPLINFCLNP